MKLCLKCKWYNENDEMCFRETKRVGKLDDETCRHWETKLERRCENCEFFDDTAGEYECRRHAPAVEMGWPYTSRNAWCGEFRGKE